VEIKRYPFLEGGGEMGELTRKFDWSKTSIGSPDQWPSSLRTMVNVVLTSRFPMFLWWGKDLVQFYNDAYRPSLGMDGKHPTALGSTGLQTWPEIWDHIYPLIQTVLSGGDAPFRENEYLPIFRNGKLEDVYWTFSYSPVRGDSGEIAGVLVTCNETTQTVLQLQRAKQTEEFLSSREKYFRELTDSMPAVLWLTDANGHCHYLNRHWYEVTGQTVEESLGLGWVNATHPDDQSNTARLFNAANTLRQPFEAQYRLRQKDGSYRWTIDKGTPRYDENGEYAGMIGTVTDVHDERTAEITAHNVLASSETKFRALIEEAPVATCFFTGADMTIEIANEKMLSYWGKDKSAIGKPLTQAVPEVVDQPFPDLLQEVYKTGQVYQTENAKAVLHYNGGLRTYYFNYTYKPLFDERNEVYGILNMAVDVTERVALQQRLEESQQELLSYFHESPVGVAAISVDGLTFRMANPFYGELVGRSVDALIGKPLLEALPELAGQGFDKLLKDVIESGKPYTAKEVAANLFRNEQMETVYVDLLYQPRRSSDNEVTGVLVVATDVTEQVYSRKKVEESERRFRLLIEEAPVGTCLYVGPRMEIAVANEIILGYWGKARSVIGMPMLEAMPELKDQSFPAILEEVYKTGKTYEEKAARADLVVDGVLSTYYFDFTYKPLLNAAGEVYAILDMAIDVTEQVKARTELQESETRLSAIIASAPAGIGLFVGPDLVIEKPNQTFIDIVGKGPDITGKPLREVMPELVTEGQPFLKILNDVLTTGKMYQSSGAQVKIVKNGVLTYNYYNITYTPVADTNGNVYAILDIAIDVTEQVLARQQLEQAEAALREAIELAQLGTWHYDATSGYITYSSRLMQWFGLDRSRNGGHDFSVIHPDDRGRVQQLIQNTLRTESNGVLDTEYLAVNLVTGQQLIIHVLGKKVYHSDGTLSGINGIAQDVTLQRQNQKALESEVQARTEQLAAVVEELQVANEELAESNERLIHSNDELAQYAYVASHDLQEPLRKIRVFTSRLTGQSLTEKETNLTLEKISASAERMTQLIQDLLEFSRLLKAETEIQTISLTDVVNAVVNDFELTITEKNAEIVVEKLPMIQAVPLQMNQLFFNLLSNSLKFVAPGTAPRISIQANNLTNEQASRYLRKTSKGRKYYDISITDNGIGFESHFSEQIFEVFKRLHGRDLYPGSGIGLSLCRRIVGNHNGFLYAESAIGKGTTFHVILPNKQTE
jgi:PAS domain S-box-containing protein